MVSKIYLNVTQNFVSITDRYIKIMFKKIKNVLLLITTEFFGLEKIHLICLKRHAVYAYFNRQGVYGLGIEFIWAFHMMIEC